MKFMMMRLLQVVECAVSCWIQLNKQLGNQLVLAINLQVSNGS